MTREAASQSHDRRGLPGSLGPILMGIAILGLVVTNVMMYRELVTIRRSLHAAHTTSGHAHWPLSAEEVARQFQERTTLGPITTTVKDVRYSPEEDSYKVGHSWENSKNGEAWTTDTTLTSNGYGEYYGVIRSDSFTTPLGGYENGFAVAVKTPSPLDN